MYYRDEYPTYQIVAIAVANGKSYGYRLSTDSGRQLDVDTIMFNELVRRNKVYNMWYNSSTRKVEPIVLSEVRDYPTVNLENGVIGEGYTITIKELSKRFQEFPLFRITDKLYDYLTCEKLVRPRIFAIEGGTIDDMTINIIHAIKWLAKNSITDIGYIKCNYYYKMDDVYSELRKLKSKKIRKVFVDNIDRVEGFCSECNNLSDKYVSGGLRIVVSGKQFSLFEELEKTFMRGRIILQTSEEMEKYELEND